MKYTFKLLLSIILLCSTSCAAQKLIQKSEEIELLKINKLNFIGKPLKVLLTQIKPQINLVFGNPANTSANAVGGTSIRFHFITKDEFANNERKNQKSTAFVANFKVESKNQRKPFPPGGLIVWTDKETKEYGDMIIEDIRIIKGL